MRTLNIDVSSKILSLPSVSNNFINFFPIPGQNQFSSYETGVTYETKIAFAEEIKFSSNDPGTHLLIIDNYTGQVLFQNTFATHQSLDRVNELATKLENIPAGTIVVLAMNGEANKFFDERIKKALESVGSCQVRNVGKTDVWLLIGAKGFAPGSVSEALGSSEAALETTVNLLDEIKFFNARIEINNENQPQFYVNDKLVEFTSTGLKTSRGIYLNQYSHSGSIQQMICYNFFADRTEQIDDHATFNSFLKNLHEIPIGTPIALFFAETACAYLAKYKDTENVQRLMALLKTGVLSELSDQKVWGYIGELGISTCQSENIKPINSVQLTITPRKFINESTSKLDGMGITLNGAVVAYNDSKQFLGITLVVINQNTGVIEQFKRYDTLFERKQINDFLSAVGGIPDGRLVIVTVAHEPAKALLGDGAIQKNIFDALKAIGSSKIEQLDKQEAYILVAQKGKQAVYESMSLSSPFYYHHLLPTFTVNEIKVLSEGKYSGGGSAKIVSNNEVIVDLAKEDSRGFSVAVLNKNDGSLIDKQRFDTFANKQAALDLAEYINKIPSEHLVAIAVGDDGARYVTGKSDNKWPGEQTDAVLMALKELGAQKCDQLAFRESYALVGSKAQPGLTKELLLDINHNKQELYVQTMHSRHPNYICPELFVVSQGTGTAAKSCYAKIQFGGKILVDVKGTSARGLYIVVLDALASSVIDTKNFDTFTEQGALAFADYVRKIKQGCVVAIAVCDEAANYITGIGAPASSWAGKRIDVAVEALKSLGSELAEQLRYRASYALVGRKGSNKAYYELTDETFEVRVSYPERQDLLCQSNFLPNRSMNIQAISKGKHNSNQVYAQIIVNGEMIINAGESQRGINLAVFDERTGQKLETRHFDTYENKENALAFAKYVKGLPDGRLVALAVCDEVARFITGAGVTAGAAAGEKIQAAIDALESLGSIQARNLVFRQSFALIGYKNVLHGEGSELLAQDRAECQYLFSPKVKMHDINYQYTLISSQEQSQILLNDRPLFDSEAGDKFEIKAAVFDQYSGTTLLTQNFAFTSDGKGEQEFVNFIYSITASSHVAIALQAKNTQTTQDSIWGQVSGNAIPIITQMQNPVPVSQAVQEALASLGAALAHKIVDQKNAYVLLGIKGAAPGSVREMWRESGAINLNTVLSMSPEHPFDVMVLQSQANENNLSAIALNGRKSNTLKGSCISLLDPWGKIIKREKLSMDAGGLATLNNIKSDITPDTYITLMLDLHDVDQTFRLSLQEALRSFCEKINILVKKDEQGSWMLLIKNNVLLCESFLPFSKDQAAKTTPSKDKSLNSVIWLKTNSLHELEKPNPMLSVYGVASDSTSSSINLAGFPLSELAGPKLQACLEVVTFAQDDSKEPVTKRFTMNDKASIDNFAAYIECLPAYADVILVTRGEISLNYRAMKACQSLGSSYINFSLWPAGADIYQPMKLSGSWALIGFKGAAPGAVPESYNPEGRVSCSITVPNSLAEIKYVPKRGRLLYAQVVIGVGRIAWAVLGAAAPFLTRKISGWINNSSRGGGTADDGAKSGGKGGGDDGGKDGGKKGGKGDANTDLVKKLLTIWVNQLINNVQPEEKPKTYYYNVLLIVIACEYPNDNKTLANNVQQMVEYIELAQEYIIKKLHSTFVAMKSNKSLDEKAELNINIEKCIFTDKDSYINEVLGPNQQKHQRSSEKYIFTPGSGDINISIQENRFRALPEVLNSYFGEQTLGGEAFKGGLFDGKSLKRFDKKNLSKRHIVHLIELCHGVKDSTELAVANNQLWNFPKNIITTFKDTFPIPTNMTFLMISCFGGVFLAQKSDNRDHFLITTKEGKINIMNFNPNNPEAAEWLNVKLVRWFKLAESLPPMQNRTYKEFFKSMNDAHIQALKELLEQNVELMQKKVQLEGEIAEITKEIMDIIPDSTGKLTSLQKIALKAKEGQLVAPNNELKKVMDKIDKIKFYKDHVSPELDHDISEEFLAKSLLAPMRDPDTKPLALEFDEDLGLANKSGLRI